MYLQCSQTSLRTTAAIRSFQCWENIRYAAAGNTPTVFEESPCRAKHFQTRQHILSKTAKARSLHHNSSSQRFRNPASQPANQKLTNSQPGLQGSCQPKCIDPSYLYLFSLILSGPWLKHHPSHQSQDLTAGTLNAIIIFHKNPSGSGPALVCGYMATNAG